MNTSHNEPGGGMSPFTKRLLYRFLPAVGTLLLLYLMSGGALADTWLFLLRMLPLTATSWQNGTFLMTLIIVMGQCLLQVVAWIWLIWLVVREGIQILGPRAQLVVPVRRQRLVNQPTRTPVLAASYHAPIPPLSAPLASAPVQLVPRVEPVQQQVPAVTPPPEAEEAFSDDLLLTNPFDTSEAVPVEGPQGAAESLKTPTTVHKAPQLQAADEAAPSAQERSSLAISDTPAAPLESASRDAVEVNVEEAQDNATHGLQIDEGQEHFSSVLQELGFVLGPSEKAPEESSQASEQETMPASNKPRRASKPASDPFEVKSDVLNLFAPPEVAQPDSAESSDEPQKQANPTKQRQGSGPIQTQAFESFDDLEEELLPEVTPEQPFVYGHPFEGPLPEVFRHDEELRRSIREQIEEERKPRSSKKKLSSDQGTAKRTTRRKSDQS